MLLVIYLGLTLLSYCLFSGSTVSVPYFPSFGLVKYFQIFIFPPIRSLVIQSFIFCCVPSDYSVHPCIIRSYLKFMLLLFLRQSKNFKRLYSFPFLLPWNYWSRILGMYVLNPTRYNCFIDSQYSCRFPHIFTLPGVVLFFLHSCASIWVILLPLEELPLVFLLVQLWQCLYFHLWRTCFLHIQNSRWAGS